MKSYLLMFVINNVKEDIIHGYIYQVNLMIFFSKEKLKNKAFALPKRANLSMTKVYMIPELTLCVYSINFKPLFLECFVSTSSKCDWSFVHLFVHFMKLMLSTFQN